MISSEAQVLPSEDSLPGTQNQSQDELPSKEKIAESEALYEGLPRLTTKEAYAIAKERGFSGTLKTLTNKANEKPERIKERFNLVRVEGGRNAIWLDISADRKSINQSL